MITAETINRIVRFRGNGLPVVSLYARVPTDLSSRGAMVRSQVDRALHDLRLMAKDHTLGHDAIKSIRGDIDRIAGMAAERRWLPGAVALFSCSGRGFFEQSLGNSRMCVNAAGIDRAHATARNGGDIEAPIFPARREQLNGVAWLDLEQVGQSISNNHAGRVVAKIIESAIDDLLRQIGRTEMRCRIDAEKLGRGCFEPGPRANRAAKHRRACNHVGKLPADPHDFAHVRDSFEIISVRGR